RAARVDAAGRRPGGSVRARHAAAGGPHAGGPRLRRAAVRGPGGSVVHGQGSRRPPRDVVRDRPPSRRRAGTFPRVTLHPLAEQFGSVADAYERGRPEYPPAVAGALAAELQLAPGARVLDLGAGTGKLARALLAAGLDVIAVEPQAELRALLAENVGRERALDGL